MLRVFQHYIPKPLILLVSAEILILYLSVYAGVEIRFIDSPEEKLLQSFDDLMPRAFAYCLVMWLSMISVGLYSRDIVDDFAGIIIRMTLGFSIGFLGNTLVFYIFPDFFFGRGILAISMIISFIGILFARTVFQKLNSNKLSRHNIVVIGTGDRAKILEKMQHELEKQGYYITGFILSNQSEVSISKNRIINIENSLADFAQKNHVDEIILAMSDRRQGFPVEELLQCKMSGIEVRYLVHFLERVTGHIELDDLQPSVMIFSTGFTKAVSQNIGKRIFDIITSLLLLIITSPLLIITYCAIWLSTLGRHPVLYTQTRIGLGNRPFNVIKFRSMSIDAEKNGAQFAKKKDSRVTIIGSFIRKTRIDELPQLFNVLKGDMSFVGPRPERPQFVDEFAQSIKHYSLRHTVKPGITGWAQICYPYGDTVEDSRNKLQYDLYYIKNYSLFLDMTILLQTVQVVLFGQGAR